MIVVLNVGSNFSDGTFKFIPIPENHNIKSGIEPNTYDNLGYYVYSLSSVLNNLKIPFSLKVT